MSTGRTQCCVRTECLAETDKFMTISWKVQYLHVHLQFLSCRSNTLYIWHQNQHKSLRLINKYYKYMIPEIPYFSTNEVMSLCPGTRSAYNFEYTPWCHSIPITQNHLVNWSILKYCLEPTLLWCFYIIFYKIRFRTTCTNCDRHINILKVRVNVLFTGTLQR